MDDALSEHYRALMSTVHIDQGSPTLITAELPHARSVAVCVYVGVGSRYEPKAMAGVAHFVEHMVFKGTNTWPTARQLSEAIEVRGGSHNAMTDRETTVYYTKVPADAVETAIDVLSEMVCSPLFEDSEFQKERAVILDELAMVEDAPGELVGVLMDQLLWPDHPMGANVAGVPETVSALTREQAQAFRQRHYTSENIVVAVSGAFDRAKVCDRVSERFHSLADGKPGVPRGVSSRWPSSRIGFRYKPTEQAHLMLCYPTVSRVSERRFAVQLVNTLLGEGMSSRLFEHLRERRALAYDVGSFVSEYADCGVLSAYMACDPDDAKAATSAMRSEIGSLVNTIEEAELEKAKHMLRGRIQLRLEDTFDVASWLAAQKLLFGNVRTAEHVIASIDNVTLDQVRHVARDFLAGTGYLSAVGPFESVCQFSDH